MVTSVQASAFAASLTWSFTSAVAMETGSVTTDFRPLPVSSRDDADSGVDANMVRNAVVASVVGVGCVATFCLLVLFGVLHCHFTKDKVRDLDGMEYVYQDEYEARINFEVLDELDPSMREKIDLDFLAHLTNTDPVLLAKYKVQPKPDSSRCSVADHDTTSQHFGSHLQLPLPPLSPAQNSLKGVCSLRRSSTVKPQSTTTPTHSCPVIKRVATFTDINDLLNKSLNKSQTGVTRPTGLLQSHDSISHRGSHPDTDGDHKPAEEVAQHLLRLLSAVKMSDQENEQGSNLTTSKPQP